MGVQENIATVKSAYEAFGRGDIDGLIATLDANIEWFTPGPSDLATAGNRRGQQQVKEFFANVDELFDFQRFEPKTFIADGDTVVVLGEDTYTFKPTGKSLGDSWAHVMTVKNGKIVRFQEYLDTAAIVAELRAAQAKA
jgi:uncharacterized protein